MQPSEYEIQREVEVLRDLRRRSTSQGVIGGIDPDLPSQPSSTSPTTSYWPGKPPSLTDDESALSSLEDVSTADHCPNNPADDPFHLFWVPASVHPEIAPAEFRAFLKEHAADGTAVLRRSNSNASTSSGLGRKKSMLSRQYSPSENDGVEHEEVVPVRRRSSIYTNVGPQLTIDDLQKLELLAEEASQSDDPSKLRNILRRSLSLNVSPSVLDEMDDLPDLGDEADSPIIVPPPGQILRRAARTKIRKPGLPGDGGGHRFGSSRRTARPSTAPEGQTLELHRISTSSSSSDHGDSYEAPLARPRVFSNEGADGDAASRTIRPESYSEETFIYDAYATTEEDSEEVPFVVTSPPPIPVDLPVVSTQPEPEPMVQPPALVAAPPVTAPVIHQPQPQRYLVPPPQSEQQSPRTPSPEEPPASQASRSPTQEPLPPSPQQRKDKKGGLFKWGGDKGAKKTSKERDRENRERAEKEGGFLSTIFGGSKKKQDEPPPLMAHSPNAGREAAQALLGASKSYVPPSSPIPTAAGANPYARYPIHVERAIYRLSHIKLANPRRPLYEQVLISNLMFWYLGVINKSPTSPSTNAKADTTAAEKEQKEKEQREKEQREKEERLKAEKERERLEKEKELEQKKKETPPRRGSLTKSTGAMPGGGRRAEMPVRGPQYDVQHRVMEQEYNGYGGQPGFQPAYNGPVYIGGQPAFNPPQGQQGYSPQPGFDMQIPNSLPMNRAASAPANPISVMQPPLQPLQQMPPYPPLQQQSGISPMLGQQPQLQIQVPNNFYYGPVTEPARAQNLPPTLPPGAMAPMSADQAPWLSAPPQLPSTRRTGSPPLPSNPYPATRRSRSPPPPQRQNVNPNRYAGPDTMPMPVDPNQGGRVPNRSMSASVQPSPVVNGRARKGVSAHATTNGRRPRTADSPMGGMGAEEDVPLAMWQQQQRRK